MIFLIIEIQFGTFYVFSSKTDKYDEVLLSDLIIRMSVILIIPSYIVGS